MGAGRAEWHAKARSVGVIAVGSGAPVSWPGADLEDNPSDAQISRVVDEFEKTAWAGLEPDRKAGRGFEAASRALEEGTTGRSPKYCAGCERDLEAAATGAGTAARPERDYGPSR